MGLFSRDILVKHKCHEIVISAALTGETATYKLYIDGQLIDQQQISFWVSWIGGTVTLRGQLPERNGESKPQLVRAVANLRVLRSNDYQIFIDDKEIHREKSTFGGM